MSRGHQRSKSSYLTLSKEARKAAFDKNRRIDDSIELESTEFKSEDSDEFTKTCESLDEYMVEDVDTSNEMSDGELFDIKLLL